MEQKNVHNIFVGAETGLVKGIDLEKKSWVNVNNIDGAHRENEILAMCWGNEDQSKVLFGLRNRCIVEYDIQNEKLFNNRDFVECEDDGIFKGIAMYNNNCITCTDKGILKISSANKKVEQISVGPNVKKMRQHPTTGNLIATGGEENALKLWDINNLTEPIFKAKNIKHDFLNLRVPVCDTDMGFFLHNNTVVTGTGHHQVRVYDPNCSQRRPVMEMEFDEYPIIALSVRHGTPQVVVGNTHGNMATLDLRMKGMLVNKFKGVAGSIRSIQCHPTENVVASCGLDRFLRIHDLGSKKLLHKFYLKSRLNCILLSDNWYDSSQLPDQSAPHKNKHEESIDEIEDVWESIENENATSKRRLDSEASETCSSSDETEIPIKSKKVKPVQKTKKYKKKKTGS